MLSLCRIFALPAIWTIDTFGRRNLLLVGFPLMALFLFVRPSPLDLTGLTSTPQWAGSMFFMSTENAARVPVLAVGEYSASEPSMLTRFCSHLPVHRCILPDHGTVPICIRREWP